MTYATRRHVLATYAYYQIADYHRDFADLKREYHDGLWTPYEFETSMLRLRRMYSTRCKPHIRRVNGFYEVRVHSAPGAPLHSFGGECPAVFDTFADACAFAMHVKDAITN